MWVLLAPVAIAFHQLILAGYRPVGWFLGGYFAPWSYKLAYLGFAWLADAVFVLAATMIAPSHRRVVGIVAGVATVGNELGRLAYFRNPMWPAWYSAAYAASIIAGAAVGYLIAWMLIESSKPLADDAPYSKSERN